MFSSRIKKIKLTIEEDTRLQIKIQTIKEKNFVQVFFFPFFLNEDIILPKRDKRRKREQEENHRMARNCV